MYFYVDESGHTGANLFDPEQPMLYYGILSSQVNIDFLAEEPLRELRQQAGQSRLHAAELGNSGLVPMVDRLLRLQSQIDFRFDMYKVSKPDHAIICFFDQVFDQGVNPAVTWSGYWTPLRYVLLLKLASLFNEDLARRAWSARIEIKAIKAECELVSVCADLKSRVGLLPDARSRQIISDALSWAMQNPSKIYYNTKSKADRLQVTPNIIGFQSVMTGIAARLKKNGKKASKIIIDQQSEFNKAQKTLAEYFALMRSAPMVNGPGLPVIDFSGMPKTPISFSSSACSAGLELVDIHLWIFKRIVEEKEVAPELYALVRPHLRRGRTDEISLNALAARWERWFEELPEPTENEIAKAQELCEFDEARRLRCMLKADS
ncbi:MAG: DUF3800 domain-containing protein [Fluviibacter phosphoraccumulans]